MNRLSTARAEGGATRAVVSGTLGSRIFFLAKFFLKEEGNAKPFGSVWRAAVKWVDGKDRHPSCFHVTDLTFFEGRQPPELAQYLRRMAN